MLGYNYQNSVKVILDKWTAANKEFSAFDVTTELRRLNDMAGIQFSIYHSNVRSEVHTQMSNYPNYDKKISACGAYQVYFVAQTASVSNPTVNQTASQPQNVTSVTLTKGRNGKFTVPSDLTSKLNKVNNRIVLHIDENGQHKETKHYHH